MRYSLMMKEKNKTAGEIIISPAVEKRLKFIDLKF
jgi:hypothetical protein